jgi:hypothetical protein
MANFEEENAQLRAELVAMKEDLAKAHNTISTLMAAQEQPATSVLATTEMIPSIPLSTAASDARLLCPMGALMDSQLSMLPTLQPVFLVLPIKDRFLQQLLLSRIPLCLK